MRSWLKKLLIALAVTVPLLIALLMAGAAYLNTAAMRERLVSAANAHLQGRLSIGSHHISLLSGQVRLTDVALTDAQGQPVIVIASLEGRIFWPALARRSLHVASLSVAQRLLDLRHDDQDRLNLLRIFESGQPAVSGTPESGTPLQWRLILDEIQWRVEKLLYRRAVQGLSVEAQRIELNGGGNTWDPSGRLEMKASRLRVQMPDREGIFEEPALNAAYDPRSNMPVDIALAAGRSRVSLRGDFARQQDGYAITAAGQLDVALAELRPWLPGTPPLAGRLSGQIDVQGALADPDVTMNLSLEQGAVDGAPVGRLGLAATLAARRVTLASLRAQGAYGDMELSGELDLRPLFPRNLTDPAGKSDDITYRLILDGREMLPRTVPKLQFPLGGAWQGRVTLTGKGVAPGKIDAEVETDLKVKGLHAFENGATLDGSLAGTARLQTGRLLVPHLAAELGGSRLQASGELDTNQRTFTINAALDTPQLGGLGRFFDIYLPDGRASAHIQGQGPWQHPRAHLDLQGSELAMGAWRFGTLTATADLGPDGVIQVPQLVLRNHDGRINGSGSLRLFNADGMPLSDPIFTLALAGQRLDLKDFHDGLPLKTALTAALQANGSFDRPAATLTLTDSPMRWQQMDLRAKGTAAWADGRLAISGLQLARGRSLAEIKGTAAWQEKTGGPWRDDPLINGEFHTKAFYLEDVFPKARGALSLTARANGPASRLKGAFRLEGADWRLRGQDLTSVLLAGRLEDQTLQLERLAIGLAPRQQLTGSGWYAFDERFALSLRIDGLELRHLAMLQRAYPIDGRLTLEADAQGSLDHPQAQARVAIRKPLINGKAWDDFGIELQLHDRLLTLAADLTFQLKGQARTDTGLFEISADFEQTDLAPYLAFALDEKWGGRLSGSLNAAGDWHDPKALKADLVLKDTQLTYQNTDLIGADRLEMHMADGTLRLPRTRLKLLQEGYVTAAAAGRLQAELEASLEGRLPLAALAPFTDRLERAGGELKIDLHAKGPWDAIQWEADLQPVEMSCIFTDLDQTLRHLNGRIRLTPQMLSIEALSGLLDEGRFALNGKVELAQWRPARYDMTFKGQALPLHQPDTMDLTVGADLSLHGPAGQALLDGAVVLLEGSYYRDLRYDLLTLEHFTQPRRAPTEPQADSAPEWMKTIRLNITVTHRYPFLVDNNLSRLEIVPDLEVTGTAANPLLQGRAHVRSGEILFQGRSFEVQRGVVDFLNPRRIEPTLDIQAQGQIRSWKINISITGTPDNLLLKLSSDPPESDANILSLILLGRTSNETAVNKGQGTASSQQMMASLLAATLGDDIKKKTGVDIFEMETGPEEENDSEERVQLTVGKNLTPRLTIKYELESDNVEHVQRAVSEYRLLEHIVASGFQDTAGNYGGELIFRIEFR